MVALPSHTLRLGELRKWSPIKEAVDCETNSPCYHLMKCLENITENMHTDVRVWRIKSFEKFLAR